MKKFIITYLIFSILIGVAVYFVTLTLSYNQRVFEVYNELAAEAVETLDLDEFMSMQTIAYKKVHREETDDYVIDVYQTIGKNGDTYFNQLGIFVIPIADVDYADKIEDSNDQTGIRVIRLDGDTPNETYYETYTDENYEGNAVSYGIKLMSFYFHAIDFTEDISFDIELYDYDKDMFAEFSQELTYQAYPDLEEGYNGRMDPDYLESLVNPEVHVYPKIIQNMTIYIVIDIIIGSVLYFVIKRKKQ